MSEQTVKAIYGQEPMREHEYPAAYSVGSPWMRNGAVVEAITYREHNYGDHGIGWYDVKAGGAVVASMAARAVAEIHYD